MTDIIAPWCDLPAEEAERLPTVVFDTVRDIERRQDSIHAGHRRHAKIYAGYVPVGMAWGESGIHARSAHEVTR